MQIDLDSLLDKQPLDTLAAYRDCLFVMLNCAPLRFNELLSITPDTVEVWHTMHNGTKRYCWRYESSRYQDKSEQVLTLIPDRLITIAQKAISRLRELQQKMAIKDFKSLATNSELRKSCFEIRKQYAQAIYREFNQTPVNDQFNANKSILDEYNDS